MAGGGGPAQRQDAVASHAKPVRAPPSPHLCRRGGQDRGGGEGGGDRAHASDAGGDADGESAAGSAEQGAGGGEEVPTLMLVEDGLGELDAAVIRLSSSDGLEVLALTSTHLLHVVLPLPAAGGKAEVLRSPLLYISNVRSTSTGGLLIELGDGHLFEPIEMDAQQFPLPQLQHFFTTLHAAVVAAQDAQRSLPSARARGQAGEADVGGASAVLETTSTPGPTGDAPPPPHTPPPPTPPPAPPSDSAGVSGGRGAQAGEHTQRETVDTVQQLLKSAQTSLSSKDGRHLVIITAEELIHIKAENMFVANGVAFRGRLGLVDKVGTAHDGRLRVELKRTHECTRCAHACARGPEACSRCTADANGGALDRCVRGAGADMAGEVHALDLEAEMYDAAALAAFFEDLYLAVVRQGGAAAMEQPPPPPERGAPPPPSDAAPHGSGGAAVHSAAGVTEPPRRSEADASGAEGAGCAEGARVEDRGLGAEGSVDPPVPLAEIMMPPDLHAPTLAGDSVPTEGEGTAANAGPGGGGDQGAGGEGEDEEEVGSISWRLQALERELNLDYEDGDGGEGEGGEGEGGERWRVPPPPDDDAPQEQLTNQVGTS